MEIIYDIMDWVTDEWVLYLVPSAAALVFILCLLILCEKESAEHSKEKEAEALEKEGERICTGCASDMVKNHLAAYNVVVDICPTCGGVFLDKGELEQLTKSGDSDAALATMSATTTTMMIMNS